MPSFFEKHVDELLEYIGEKINSCDIPMEEDVITRLSLFHLRRYIKNKNLKINFIEPLERIAGKNKHAFSLFILGALKLEGLGDLVSQDETTGYSYITLAAQNECPFALNAIGCFYMHGNDFIKKDCNKAIECFNKALEVIPNGQI